MAQELTFFFMCSGGVIYLYRCTWQTQPTVLIALFAHEALSASTRAGGDAGGR